MLNLGNDMKRWAIAGYAHARRGGRIQRSSTEQRNSELHLSIVELHILERLTRTSKFSKHGLSKNTHLAIFTARVRYPISCFWHQILKNKKTEKKWNSIKFFSNLSKKQPPLGSPGMITSSLRSPGFKPGTALDSSFLLLLAVGQSHGDQVVWSPACSWVSQPRLLWVPAEWTSGIKTSVYLSLLLPLSLLCLSLTLSFRLSISVFKIKQGKGNNYFIKISSWNGKHQRLSKINISRTKYHTSVYYKCAAPCCHTTSVFGNGEGCCFLVVWGPSVGKNFPKLLLESS